jgi:hypothetical protein
MSERPAAAAHHSSFITHHFLLLALTVAVALTRLFAASKSIWDWDEGLFCLALRDYNVVLHHPHPPGFPLFVGAAKLVRLVVRDDFHALRAVSLVASMFVFPAMYALARALGFAFRGAVIGALLFSFLPNVWYWGGTAFSDVFALVLALFAVALLLRDKLLAGGVLFAATLLVRPQNVLLAWPWLLAASRRARAGRVRDVVASAALIAVLVAIGYGMAARATGGWSDYIEATRQHQRYVTTVDGALNPNRPAPRDVLLEFLIDPILAHRLSYGFAVLAALAFLRPKRRHLDIVLTFLPNFLLAWLMLSVTGTSRLSLGYIPMHALLAADGIAVIAFGRKEIESALAAIVVALNAAWVWPALREVRAHDAPPVAAAKWIQQHVPRATGKVYVQAGMVPFADYFLAGYNTEEAPPGFDPTAVPEEPNAVLIADSAFQSPRAVNFVRTHRRLWGLFNRRYFECSVVPVVGGPHWAPGKIEFGDGWFAPEVDEKGRPFRWMGLRSVTRLQSLGQRGELSMQFYAPLDAEPAPEVTVVFDGIVVERFRPTDSSFRRTYQLQSRAGAPDELLLAVDRAVNPFRLGKGGDKRDLGLRVSGMSWKVMAR